MLTKASLNFSYFKIVQASLIFYKKLKIVIRLEKNNLCPVFSISFLDRMRFSCSNLEFQKLKKKPGILNKKLDKPGILNNYNIFSSKILVRHKNRRSYK